MPHNRFKILNKTLLLSVVTSQLVLAGGDIVPVEEAVTLPAVSEASTFFNNVTANGEILQDMNLWIRTMQNLMQKHSPIA